ncbi:response regulator [Edaphobacter sp.]|uniref:response regulator n=1 Tax=Edaphobacter sp. TaxID=1934404 RepID=UPI002DB8FC7D|nr:response regulator [Edaphobacter sp.]HEU5340318.1 response regulator [Edaphobacter sp.]
MILFRSMSNTPVRVLVVDDDEVSREVLSVLLESAGYAVESADSGEAALTRLRNVDHALPAVLLVDMQMPGIRGGELARQLRGLCGRATLLLAMSGSQPEDEARRGFDDFLLKPFTMEQLRAAIDGGPAQPAHDEAAGALNEAVYRKLAESMNAVQLEKLYAMCLDDAEKRIAEMRRAAARGDDDIYRREAHAIKGGCGMVGATEMQILATSMETKGIEANHVASLDEFLLASKRLRRILFARRRAT